MPDLVAHIQQAKHNEQCARMILKTDERYRDWVITSAFYTAVHLTEACFSTRHDIMCPPDLEKHTFRSQTIQREAKSAFPIYRDLRDACWNVRYLQGKQPWSKFYDTDYAQNLLDKRLPQFRSEMEKAFGVKLT